MFHTHTEACDVVWGLPNHASVIGKSLGVCSGWRFMLEVWRDDVTRGQVTKSYTSGLPGKLPPLESLFPVTRDGSYRADGGVVIPQGYKAV